MADVPDVAVETDDESGHHCPYCGEDGKSEEHILDCQPVSLA